MSSHLPPDQDCLDLDTRDDKSSTGDQVGSSIREREKAMGGEYSDNHQLPYWKFKSDQNDVQNRSYRRRDLSCGYYKSSVC